MSKPADAFVGRTGLGWGRGLHTGEPRQGPVKVEGDGRAVAGVFRLTATFGVAKEVKVRSPYLLLHDNLVCITDTQSWRYNRIVDLDHVRGADWQGGTPMKALDARHDWGVIIDHNNGDLFLAGNGSCSFIRVAVEAAGTDNATAAQAPVVEKLVTWLDPARLPVLVQLPRTEYERLRRTWGLP